MSWAQQREAIRIAAEAGVRARTSAAGSETLPLTHHHLRYAMLSRPNGELTRAGQYYYQLIGRAGSASGGSAGRLLPAVLRRRNPRVRLRTTAGQALRPSAARGADAAAAAGGAVGF